MDNAKTDIERYWVLYNTHVAAVKEMASVSYKGIDTIRIEIPQNAPTIPLSESTDFGNSVIVVKNVSKHAFLFSLSNELNDITIDYALLEKTKRIPGEENLLLVIEDTTPWVKNRRGYKYGHIRKDIVHIYQGKVEGSVISSYSSKESKPIFKACSVNNRTKSFKNLTVLRDSACLYRTNVLNVENQYNIVIENITIKTPQNSLYGDAAIRIENCYKAKILNTVIEGTYSQKNQYGYGISLNNVSDVVIVGLKGDADWGIFGNNNVNNTRLSNCDINRFDVHCYGKDIFFEKCTFRNLYNQFSSMFGDVVFKNCEFHDFIPVLFETTYNAYTEFNLRFKKCKIYVSRNKNYLIAGGDLNDKKTNERDELRNKKFPNLYIEGLTLEMQGGIDTYYLYNINRNMLVKPQDSVPGVKRLKNIKFSNDNGKPRVKTSNLECFIRKPVGKKEYAVTGVAATLFLFSICSSFIYHKKGNSND